MITLVFVRHAAHDFLGRAIAGRQPGVHLNELGKAQAARLGERLSSLPLEAIYASPLERTRETAEPICQCLGLPLQIDAAFTEVDFGEWTNCAFAELEPISAWQHFNSFRSCTPAPGGELMLEIQARVLRKLLELRARHECVAIVSHGDVIRAALAHFLGVPLDLFQRLEVDPASISIVEFGENFARVRLLNAAGEGEPLPLPSLRHQ